MTMCYYLCQINATIGNPAINVKIMTEERIVDIKEHLSQCLSDKKMYLDKDLSLVKLSIELGTNTYYLSKVINDCFSMNFKTFINKYRIEYCKDIITNNIAEIVPADKLAKECGFNSTSVFYRVFKNETDMTPQKYRLNILRTK